MEIQFCPPKAAEVEAKPVSPIDFGILLLDSLAPSAPSCVGVGTEESVVRFPNPGLNVKKSL